MEPQQPPFRHVLLVADERRPRVRELVDFLRPRTHLSVCRDDGVELEQASQAVRGEEACEDGNDDVKKGRPSSPCETRFDSETPTVDLILLAPAVRDELSPRQVDALLDRFPLAMRLLLVDNWLEGETRSGRAWPGVTRIYWDQFRPQWELAESGWLAPSDPRRTLDWRPPSWTAEDAWVLPPRQELPAANGTVWICGERPESRETLGQVCAAVGWQTRLIALSDWERLSLDLRSNGILLPDAIVYDSPYDAERRRNHLRQMREMAVAARIVALIDFPRPWEILETLEAGADRVLGRPYRIEELLVCLASDARRPTPELR